MFARKLVFPATFALLVSFAGSVSVSHASWDETYFPNVPVVTQHGEVLDFYDDLIDGKRVVVNFIYTSCPDICGLSTARMAWVRDALRDPGDEGVHFYSISLDPANDTPEKLAAYATAFSAEADWLFLTGDPADLRRIRWKLGERSRSLDEHRSDMVIGNDETGHWRRTSLMGNLGSVVRDIRDLDPQFRRAPRAFPTHGTQLSVDTSRPLAASPGEGLFLKACAACHSVGDDKQRAGPDLHGVTWRRDRAWLMRAIMDPKTLRAEGDPIMTALDARYPGVVMPDLSLSADDTRDILLYLSARSVEVEAARATPHVHAGDSTHAHHHEPAGAPGSEAASDVDVHDEHERHLDAAMKAAGTPAELASTDDESPKQPAQTTTE